MTHIILLGVYHKLPAPMRMELEIICILCASKGPALKGLALNTSGNSLN